jgi:hypothetical protein
VRLLWTTGYFSCPFQTRSCKVPVLLGRAPLRREFCAGAYAVFPKPFTAIAILIMFIIPFPSRPHLESRSIFVEGLFLHELRSNAREKEGVLWRLVSTIKTNLISIDPYLIVICVQYVLMVVFGFRLFSGFMGLLVEFLWLFVPIFVISTTCSWWFYRNTSTPSTGVIFNTLLLAWTAAVVFPF